MNECFIVRAYGVQELALMYFPDSAPHSASNQLRRWIRIPALMDKLTANSGYHIGQKILTPKQVSIIVEHLGYP